MNNSIQNKKMMLYVILVLALTFDVATPKGFFAGMKRSMSALQNPAISRSLFTGSRNVCGKPGKGGERCTPFGKFSRTDMAMSVLFLKCCRMCPSQFAQKLSLLELPSHIHRKVQQKFQAAHRQHSGQKESSFLESKVRERSRFVSGAISNMFYADGDQITESLPCCNVCPEQFYTPEDYDDINDSVTSSDEDLNSGQATLLLEQQNQKTFLHEKIANKMKASRMKKSGSSPFGSSSSNSATGYTTYSKTPVGGMTDGGANGLNTGYQVAQCCNICPEEKFPERYIGDSFKGTGTAAFLEVMRRKKGFVGSLSGMASSAAASMGPQSNGVMDPSRRARPGCCPMCPSLEHLVHGSMEPFGGVFGDGKLGGQMSEQMAAEHALDRSQMDPSLDNSLASGAMAGLFRI
jgi:hypothetical protein